MGAPNLHDLILEFLEAEGLSEELIKQVRAELVVAAAKQPVKDCSLRRLYAYAKPSCSLSRRTWQSRLEPSQVGGVKRRRLDVDCETLSIEAQNHSRSEEFAEFDQKFRLPSVWQLSDSRQRLGLVLGLGFLSWARVASSARKQRLASQNLTRKTKDGSFLAESLTQNLGSAWLSNLEAGARRRGLDTGVSSCTPEQLVAECKESIRDANTEPVLPSKLGALLSQEARASVKESGQSLKKFLKSYPDVINRQILSTVLTEWRRIRWETQVAHLQSQLASCHSYRYISSMREQNDCGQLYGLILGLAFLTWARAAASIKLKERRERHRRLASQHSATAIARQTSSTILIEWNRIAWQMHQLSAGQQNKSKVRERFTTFFDTITTRWTLKTILLDWSRIALQLHRESSDSQILGLFHQKESRVRERYQRLALQHLAAAIIRWTSKSILAEWARFACVSCHNFDTMVQQSETEIWQQTAVQLKERSHYLASNIVAMAVTRWTLKTILAEWVGDVRIARACMGKRQEVQAWEQRAVKLSERYQFVAMCYLAGVTGWTLKTFLAEWVRIARVSGHVQVNSMWQQKEARNRALYQRLVHRIPAVVEPWIASSERQFLFQMLMSWWRLSVYDGVTRKCHQATRSMTDAWSVASQIRELDSCSRKTQSLTLSTALLYRCQKKAMLTLAFSRWYKEALMNQTQNEDRNADRQLFSEMLRCQKKVSLLRQQNKMSLTRAFFTWVCGNLASKQHRLSQDKYEEYNDDRQLIIMEHWVDRALISIVLTSWGGFVQLGMRIQALGSKEQPAKFFYLKPIGQMLKTISRAREQRKVWNALLLWSRVRSEAKRLMQLRIDAVGIVRTALATKVLSWWWRYAISGERRQARLSKQQLEVAHNKQTDINSFKAEWKDHQLPQSGVERAKAKFGPSTSSKRSSRPSTPSRLTPSSRPSTPSKRSGNGNEESDGPSKRSGKDNEFGQPPHLAERAHSRNSPGGTEGVETTRRTSGQPLQLAESAHSRKISPFFRPKLQYDTFTEFNSDSELEVAHSAEQLDADTAPAAHGIPEYWTREATLSWINYTLEAVLEGSDRDVGAKVLSAKIVRRAWESNVEHVRPDLRSGIMQDVNEKLRHAGFPTIWELD